MMMAERPTNNNSKIDKDRISCKHINIGRVKHLETESKLRLKALPQARLQVQDNKSLNKFIMLVGRMVSQRGFIRR